MRTKINQISIQMLVLREINVPAIFATVEKSQSQVSNNIILIDLQHCIDLPYLVPKVVLISTFFSSLTNAKNSPKLHNTT